MLNRMKSSPDNHQSIPFQVKFFAELQQTINEDRERARKEELERLEAEEKEKEQIEAVKEKPKGKTKRERKKEAKPIVDTVNSEAGDDSKQLDAEPKKRSISFRKLLAYSFLLWFIFAMTVIFIIAQSPHVIEELIGKLPTSYQTPLLYHLQRIQQEIRKYLK